MAVIESLKGSTVVVSEVVLFERVSWGYAPSESALSTDRLPNEAEADYARRSRERATDFIRSCAVVNDDVLTEHLAQAVGDNATYGIGAAAGRLRHQITHGLRRKRLRENVARKKTAGDNDRRRPTHFSLHAPPPATDTKP